MHFVDWGGGNVIEMDKTFILTVLNNWHILLKCQNYYQILVMYNWRYINRNIIN